MKRTKIKYQKLGDGRIQVTGIENAASFSQLRKEFGDGVVSLYKMGYPHYARTVLNDLPDEIQKIVIYTNRGHPPSFLIVGRSYTKEMFSKAISFMKESGDRLGEIRKTYVDPEIKEILI